MFSILGDIISTVEGVQYCRGITSVLWRIFSTVGDINSTVEGVQYFTGIQLVLWNMFSTVDDVQFFAGMLSTARNHISTF